jgi:hypothetical protein
VLVTTHAWNFVFVACGGILTGQLGTITSPGYPSQINFASRTCEWLITVSPGMAVRLTFYKLAVGSDFHPSCRGLYVELFDDFSASKSLCRSVDIT